MNIAASIQKVTEDIILKLVKHLKKITKEDNLCLAGGVALNCVANGKILESQILKKYGYSQLQAMQEDLLVHLFIIGMIFLIMT